VSEQKELAIKALQQMLGYNRSFTKYVNDEGEERMRIDIEHDAKVNAAIEWVKAQDE